MYLDGGKEENPGLSSPLGAANPHSSLVCEVDTVVLSDWSLSTEDRDC